MAELLDLLPYRSVWVIDTEFDHPAGEPFPVTICCIAARDLKSGREVRRWLADGAGSVPFDVGHESLFVGHFTPAEWNVFEAVGWPIPLHVIDTFAEVRAAINGLSWGKANLLEAAARFGVPTMAVAAKDEGRALAMRGPPWGTEEKERLLKYCAADVDITAALFLKLLPGILLPPLGLEHAIIRGRFMRALARVNQQGIPVDADLLTRLRDNWSELKLRLVEKVDGDFGCYQRVTFKHDKFAELLNRLDLLDRWPRTATRRLSTKGTTFKNKADTHTVLRPLYELHSTLDNLRKLSLPVGKDGRHRPERWGPFGTDTGRCAPSGFIFGNARWIRHLIKPPSGSAVVYSDFKAQEIHIAARLSGDANLIVAVESGDPYLWYAKAAGLAPPDATDETHAALRSKVKIMMLGMGYGMGPHGIAQATEVSLDHAEHVFLARHKQLFPIYWLWSEARLYRNVSDLGYRTPFGWPLHVTSETPYRKLLNHPIQASGADILRWTPR